MAPFIIPSPHRFLPTSERNTTNPSPNQSPVPIPNPNPHPSKPISHSQTPSQFATKPRFTGPPKSPITNHPVKPPRPKKDCVEEFDNESTRPRLEKGYSPAHGSVKRVRGRERIDEAWDGGRDGVSGGMDDGECLSLLPASRKRKIVLSPEWNDSEDEVSREGVGMEVSAAISPLRTNTAEQAVLSPGIVSSTSPSHTGRTVPRFDFSKLTERTASKLQKVTGTGQFIFDSTLGGDSHGEALSLENTNLTLLFSPQKHRKYQYAPGGLAATVRDWVLDAAAGIGSGAMVTVLRVGTVEVGERGSMMVCGVDNRGEEGRYVLLGVRNEVVVKGCWIGVMEPCWMVELDEVWTVAVNWKVIEDDDV